MPGKYTRREQRLLAEYVAATYPGARWLFNVRLGAYPIHLAGGVPAGVDQAALSSYRRYVDAIVAWPDRCQLIEAKIVLDVDAPAKLMLYKELWPTTPEYPELVKLPFELECVSAVVDPVIAQMAANWGIACKVYTPLWLSGTVLQSQLNVAKLGNTPLPGDLLKR